MEEHEANIAEQTNGPTVGISSGHESGGEEMLTVDGSQDSSRKASVPGPVCILSLYSKTTRASEQDFYRSFLGSEQVVKGNGPLFQLFVQVILFQDQAEPCLANR